MTLKPLSPDFTVCKVSDISQIDFNTKFTFFSKTDDELSLVCPSEKTPDNATHTEDGWKALKIEGSLDFSLIGIIAKISGILAENQISVFVISTFNTDYILVKKAHFQSASAILSQSGYHIQ